MMKRLAVFITSLCLMLGILTPAIASASVFDGSKTAVCNGINFQDTGSCTAPKKDVNSIVKTSISIFSAIIGVIAVFVIIIAGVKYITSGGDSAKTAQAKDTLLYAAIGLAIVILAQVIVQFVIKKVR
jgi:hypothetical protein